MLSSSLLFKLLEYVLSSSWGKSDRSTWTLLSILLAYNSPLPFSNMALILTVSPLSGLASTTKYCFSPVAIFLLSIKLFLFKYTIEFIELLQSITTSNSNS